MTARKLTYITPTAKIVAERSVPSLRPIAEAVAEFYDLTYEALLERRRRLRTAVPRHVVMLLAYETSDLGISEIGRQMGRHHTTVLHGLRRIRTAIERDEEIRADVDELRAKVRGVA